MADKPTETKPALSDPETGVAMHGKHPLNRRLRAESLARAGAKSDPDELVDAELIENTRERLEREKAAEPKKPGKPSGRKPSKTKRAATTAAKTTETPPAPASATDTAGAAGEGEGA